MVRAYPAEWPVSDGLADQLPSVYFHMVDQEWPPANPDADNGRGLPAGWADVSDWDIEAELDAPLLPGQIKDDAKFITATGSCTIEVPEGVVLAPWRDGAERTPPGGKAELWASYNGPTGSTAYLLGQFVLDPMKGNTANPYLSVSFVQDLVRLRRDHTIPTRPGFGGSWGNSLNIIEYAATASGYEFESLGGFVLAVDFTYFPRRTDMLDAIQQITNAGLGALFLSMDGTTLRLLGPDYLLGTGTPIEIVDVADQFNKLEWSQDPNATVDRIEVTWVPPQLDTDSDGPYPPFDQAAIWTAPRGLRLTPGQTYAFNLDPGSYIQPAGIGTTFDVPVNASRDGLGTGSTMSGTIEQRSSGDFRASITNTGDATKYFVLKVDPPGTASFGSWDVPKGTPSYMPGVIDRATETDSTRTLEWGVPADEATNALRFDLGRNVQADPYAIAMRDRIIARVTSPTYVIEDVRLPLDFRRELGDLYRVQASVVDFDQRALVTKIKLDGNRNEIVQTASLAILPLVDGD